MYHSNTQVFGHIPTFPGPDYQLGSYPEFLGWVIWVE